MILGVLSGYGIGYLSGYELEVSWSTALMAMIVSISVGVASGYIPAHRASKLKPVDALRYE